MKHSPAILKKRIIIQVKWGLIPGIQDWISTQESINVIYHINKIMEKVI